MPSRKGFDGPLLHSRNVPQRVFALLLSGLPLHAGVFAGLNSENSEACDPPATGEWVFSFWVQSTHMQSAVRRFQMSVVQESRIPRILESAPDFEAKSTQGLIRLSDFTSKGKYVLLFSHPADFTPVCSTEFVAFARAWQRFDDLGVLQASAAFEQAQPWADKRPKLV